MAVVDTTIGTDARDYETHRLWEADDGGGDGLGNDDCTGSAYDDTPFDESWTIDFNANSIVQTVAVGERHDGTAGTGARIVRTVVGNVVQLSINFSTLIEWLEVDMNGNYTDDAGAVLADTSTANDRITASKMLVHGAAGIKVSNGFRNIARQLNVLNCFIWGFTSSQNTGDNQAAIFGNDDKVKVLGNTIYDFDRTDTHASGHSYGISVIFDDANTELKNNIVCDVAKTGGGGATVADFSFAGNTNLISLTNLSSDDTADDGGGSGHLINKAVADQFVSTSPVNLHLKAGADAIDAGTDLGTTPTGVEIDIDGRDRDAQGDTWDMGADEYVSAPPAGNPWYAYQQQIA